MTREAFLFNSEKRTHQFHFIKDILADYEQAENSRLITTEGENMLLLY